MQYLNIIYFIVISLLGVKFLTSKGGIVKSPFDKSTLMKLDGPEMFWCLTFSTGLLAFSVNVGLDLMAIRLLVLELLCIVGLFVCKNKPVMSLPIYVYIAYLLWLCIGLTYTISPAYGVRVILKYLYPFLLCLFASAAVRHIEVWMKSALLARLVAVLSLLVVFIPYASWLMPGVFWYATALAINYISIMIFSLALVYFTNEKKKNLIYTVLFMLPCFLWVFRTSIMGSFVALMAFYLIKYRLRAAPIIFGFICLGVVAVFTIPSLKAKMFRQENGDVTIEQFRSGQLTMDDVDTNARQAVWEELEDRFYHGHELTGSGTGSAQQYMYENNVFNGLKIAHSDFVQMKCDNGLVGLILYSSIAALVLLHCILVYWRNRDPKIKLAAIVAGASMAGVFVTLYSDNVVNYSMATLSMPFGFYGMLLGLLKQKQLVRSY